MSRQTEVTELESQFIMRLPEEPARHLRDLLRTGCSLKERCWIRLEQELRYGEVKLDNWLMYAKLVDLPTVTESLKTIDTKNFYKTADVCQMLICKEEADQPDQDQEQESPSPAKGKKKDPFKVEKKYLWPHGLTPPTKNVRKKRFRKTLKKKYMEVPEIEKEVKRLLRADNFATSVKWEVVSDEEASSSSLTAKGDQSGRVKTEPAPKKEKRDAAKRDAAAAAAARPRRDRSAGTVGKNSSADASNVDVERDIFGGAVSDSDEELGSNTNVEMDYSDSYCDDSRLTDSNSYQGGPSTDSPSKGGLPTHFAADMFGERRWSDAGASSTPNASAAHSGSATSTRDFAQSRLERSNAALESLRGQRARKEQEIANMDNHALRQRFQEILQNLNREIGEKEREIQDLQATSGS